MPRYRFSPQAPRGMLLVAMRSALTTVTVVATGLPATLFEPDGTTPKTNPFRCSDDGVVDFYTAAGACSVLSQKEGFDDVTTLVGSAAAQLTDDEVAGIQASVSGAGNGNLFVGPGTGNSSATGLTNVGIGTEGTMSQLTGGIDNTAVGAAAFAALQTGVGGSAFGRLSCATMTVSTGNTGFGDSTLRFTTSGTYNVAMGYRAGEGNTTGLSNTYIGGFSGTPSTTGSYNTCVGAGTMFLSTGAGIEKNTAVGAEALNAAVTNENCAFGFRALIGTYVGYRNNGFGAYAGGAVTSGYGNIHIGYNAGGGGTGQKVDAVNTIVLGYNIGSTKDNQVIIGDSAIVETILRGRVILGGLQTPASATDVGVAGTVCADANYIYVCTATNTWKRVAIATW